MKWVTGYEVWYYNSLWGVIMWWFGKPPPSFVIKCDDLAYSPISDLEILEQPLTAMLTLSFSMHTYTLHMWPICTYSHSAQVHTLYRITLPEVDTVHRFTLCTGSHRAHVHTMYRFTLYKGSHSTQVHTLYRITLPEVDTLNMFTLYTGLQSAH